MMSKTYKAIFSMNGFIREMELSGEPGIDVGFPVSGDSDLSKRGSLSLYFRLTSFDGKIAHYLFYGWRDMTPTETNLVDNAVGEE